MPAAALVDRLLDSPALLAAVAVGALVVAGLGYAVVRAGTDTAKALPFYLGAKVKHGLVRLFLGSNGNYIGRLMVWTILFFGAIAGVGGWYLLNQGLQSTSASSGPIIRTVLKYATSPWAYLGSALFFARGFLFGLRRILVAKAARKSGYSYSTIARIGEEAKTTNGTVPVVVLGDDERDDLASRIYQGFFGEGETITDQHAELDEHEGESEADSEAESDDAPAPDLGTTDDAEDADDNLPVLKEDLPATPDAADVAARDDADDDRRLSERLKMFKMHLLSRPNTDRLIWRLLVPMALIFLGELILVRFWRELWVYPVLIAGAIAGGVAFYAGMLWRDQRRLRKLRADHTTGTWNALAVLCKRVETDDMDVYMAFMGGRSYVDRDPERLAETVAVRALESSNGLRPSPAIQERWAWCAKRYIPLFDGWVEQYEMPAIHDKLVSEVRNSSDGMLPAAELAHRVIEDGRKKVWLGYREVGYGHDPRLVAEMYRRLTPAAFTPREVTLEDFEGNSVDATAVRLRNEAPPASVADLRATFSQQFPVRKLPTRYDLPDINVSDEIEGVVVNPDRVPDAVLNNGPSAHSTSTSD